MSCYNNRITRPVYDNIGSNYNTNRAADERITGKIIDLLELPRGSLIADIGAGTGNYSTALADRGYRVIAVEPSEVMRQQRSEHPGVRWIAASAESLPLKDASVNGVVIVLAVHHFHSPAHVAAELHRICPEGPVILFTYDPQRSGDFWFYRYFPDIYQREFERFPPVEEISGMLASGTWNAEVSLFALPHDLQDRNMHAGWNRPELYFDEQFRRNVSGLALAPAEEISRALSRLKQDLESGAWNAKYGELRDMESLDTGFVFIRLAQYQPA